MNTSRRKKNIIFITILSVLGLLGAMALQVTWIFNSYELIRSDIQKESYATIEKALKEEGNIRFGRTPKGTEILSGPTNDTIPPMAYFYQRLTEMGYPMCCITLIPSPPNFCSRTNWAISITFIS